MTEPPEAMLGNARFRREADRTGNRRFAFVKDPAGAIYAPASARRGTVAKLNYAFSVRAAEGSLCSACGSSFGDEARIVMPGTNGTEEPPLHVRCAAYALRACPHLARSAHAVNVCSRVNHEIDGRRRRAYFSLPDGRSLATSDCVLVAVGTFLTIHDDLATKNAEEAMKIALRHAWDRKTAAKERGGA